MLFVSKVSSILVKHCCNLNQEIDLKKLEEVWKLRTSTCSRVVKKGRGQSNLRKNYCELCRNTYVLLNEYQLKISMQKII